MKRELKFRAWDGEQMISPDYIGRDGNAYWKENSIPTYSEKVMQYTGLKDKNGKEIYEGDIYNTIVGNYRVLFDNGCFCVTRINFIRPSPINWGSESNDYEVDNFSNEIEIIGNIYQNPELLK